MSLGDDGFDCLNNVFGFAITCTNLSLLLKVLIGIPSSRIVDRGLALWLTRRRECCC
jgi:hypothetical protein